MDNLTHWQIVNSGKTLVSNSAEGWWNDACAYFKWCDEHPIIVKRTILTGKDAGRFVNITKPRPYTIKGLCLHCGILDTYLNDIRQTNDKTSLYYIVASRILCIIFVQNQEYAMVDEFNPIFTAKVLNMEKDDTPPSSIKIELVPGLPPLSTSENEILEKLDLERQSNPLDIS